MFFKKKEPKYLKNTKRIIVVGAGQVGSYVAQQLSLEGKDVVVIDKNQERLSILSNQLDIQVVAGEVFSPAILLKAGIHDSEIIIAATNSDEVNLSICLLSHALNPDIEKIVRLRHVGVESLYPELSAIIPKLISFINPEVSVVNTIVRSLYLPGFNEYSEFAEGKVKLASFQLTAGILLDTPLSTLSSVFNNNSFTVAAVNRNKQLSIANGDTILRKDDVVYFAFTDESVPKLLKLLGKEVSTIRNVIIVGGGNIGYKLAQELEKDSFSSVKLIEMNKERANYLAEHLDSTLVILGDATEEVMLESLTSTETDVLIALTGDEENNLIACLLARSRGTKETVCRLDRRSYISLANLIGIDHTITPRLSAVNSILHCIRRGNALSSISVGNNAAEALEFIITEDSPLANLPIYDIALPKKATILAIIKDNNTIIARGSSILEVGCRVLIMADKNVLDAVETLFSYK